MKSVKLWVLADERTDAAASLQRPLALFQRERPGLRVELSCSTAASVWKRLFHLLKSPGHEAFPDAVQVPSHWVPTLAHLGLLQDLKELDPHLDLEAWVPLARTHCRQGEGVFSLPWWLQLSVLYYRKDALRRAGLDPRVDLADWEGLRRSCRRLAASWARQGRHPLAGAGPGESISMADLAPCVWRRGGELFSADGGRALFHREDACRGIHDYLQLMADGWMAVKDRQGLPPRDLFEGGSALQFSSRLPALGGPIGPEAGGKRRGPAVPGGSVGAAPFPSGGSARRSAATSAHLAVLREARAPQEAYALIRELALRAEEPVRRAGALPATRAGLERALEERPEIGSAFSSALAAAQPLPNMPLMGSLDRVFERSMERMVGEVVRGSYGHGVLRQELIHAAAEADYLLAIT